MPTLAISTASRARILARAARFACGSSPGKTRPGSRKTRGASYARKLREFSRCRSKRSHRLKTPMRTLSRTDRLPAKERDDLNNGAMIQRQVSGRINNRDEGIGARITRILDDQRNFKIDNPEAQKQLEDMLARLAMIREQNLGPAEQGLTRATKGLEAKNALDARIPALRTARPSLRRARFGAGQGSPGQRAREDRHARVKCAEVEGERGCSQGRQSTGGCSQIGKSGGWRVAGEQSSEARHPRQANRKVIGRAGVTRRARRRRRA